MNATEARSVLKPERNRSYFIRALRDTAERWDAKPDGEDTFSNGICYAVSRNRGFKNAIAALNPAGPPAPCAYRNVDAALTLMQDDWENSHYGELEEYPRDRESWVNRATMCLFMAEWLESDFE